MNRDHTQQDHPNDSLLDDPTIKEFITSSHKLSIYKRYSFNP